MSWARVGPRFEVGAELCQAGVAECFLPPRLHQLPSPSWPEEGDLLNSPPGACVPVRKGRPELAGRLQEWDESAPLEGAERQEVKTMASGCPHCLFPVVFRLPATDIDI